MDIQKQRATMMGVEDVKRVLFKLSIPAIIGMMINAIYNLVDTMFVGKLGTSAIGAASVAFPLFMLISAVGLAFGIGGASYISRLLGQNNKKEADKTASTAFFSSLLLGIIFTFIGSFLLEHILRLFGASDTIMPYAKDYSFILILGSVFTMINMTMNNLLRSEGSVKFTMIAMSTGAILNIILDPIFIFTFNMGISGAAIATVLSQIVSSILLLSYFFTGKSYLKLSIKNIKLSKTIYGQIMKIGIPTFFRQFLTSMSLGLINVSAKHYGDAAVASMGITFRFFMLGAMVIFGFSQGFQPLAGYNYGAKNYSRLQEAIKTSLIWTTIFTTTFAIISIIIAEPIVSIFSKDPKVIEIASNSLRAVNLLFPFFGFQTIIATLFQALGKGLPAAILALSRQGIFLIPAVLILPKLFDLNGVIYSQPFADLCTTILTIFFAIKITRDLKSEASLEDNETLKEVEIMA